MNYQKYHYDYQQGMEFLMNRIEWAIGWLVFIVCFPLTWPL